MEHLGSASLSDEAAETLVGAAVRAQFYRERASSLEAQIATTDLPRIQERLRSAAERFHELAAAEEALAQRKARMAAGERASPLAILTGARGSRASSHDHDT